MKRTSQSRTPVQPKMSSTKTNVSLTQKANPGQHCQLSIVNVPPPLNYEAKLHFVVYVSF